MSRPIVSMTPDLIPPEIIAKDGVVQFGSNIYTISKPENAVRWIARDGEKVLQQCWSITMSDKGWCAMHQEWRDVPTEVP